MVDRRRTDERIRNLKNHRVLTFGRSTLTFYSPVTLNDTTQRGHAVKPLTIKQYHTGMAASFALAIAGFAFIIGLAALAAWLWPI